MDRKYLAKYALDEFGMIDVKVNNAGYPLYMDIIEKRIEMDLFRN